MVSFEHLITQYGPLAVFLGAGLEGHTVVIAGGVMAHQNLMPLWLTFVCAWAGSWLVDQLLFLGGRRWRQVGIVQRAIANPAFDKALGFIARYPVGYTLVFRFLYGLRMVSPVAIGVSRVPASLFFVLNILAAALWAAVFTAIGYLFGETFGAWLRNLGWLERYGPWAMAAAIVAIAAYYLVRNSRRKRKA